MSFLTIERLTKTYDQIVAVGGISLDIEQGEFISLLGPSGCGKTTTLQMIAGFVEVTSGRIILEGRDLAEVPPAKRGLGMVFQSYALFPHMSAAPSAIARWPPPCSSSASPPWRTAIPGVCRAGSSSAWRWPGRW